MEQADDGGGGRPPTTETSSVEEKSERRSRKRHRRPPRWTVPVIIVATLVAGEVGARTVGPNIPRRSGTEERAFIKADQMFGRRNTTSIAILGSSETAGGLIPSVMTASSPQLGPTYNAALAGTFLPTYRDWSERVVIPALHPKVMVIGMLPMTVGRFDNIDTDAYEKPRQAYLSAIDQITGGRLGTLGWRIRQRSALIRYRPYLRQPTLLWRGLRTTLAGGRAAPSSDDAGIDWKKETDPVRVAENTGRDGDVFDYHQPSEPTSTDPLAAALYDVFEKGTLDLSGLADFVGELRAQDITPVLLLLPIDRAPILAAGGQLSVLDGWSRAMQRWADRNHVAMRDEFTTEWPSGLFHDRNHLDLAGARRLSAKVGTWLGQLCDTGDLPGGCVG